MKSLMACSEEEKLKLYCHQFHSLYQTVDLKSRYNQKNCFDDVIFFLFSHFDKLQFTHGKDRVMFWNMTEEIPIPQNTLGEIQADIDRWTASI